MGIVSALEIGGKALTQVAKKDYVKPLCKTTTLEPIGLKMEQLTSDIVQTGKIKIVGMNEKHKDIYGLIESAMSDVTKKTHGRGLLPTEIRFEPLSKFGNEGVACVDREGILRVNSDYFDNIDSVIINDLNQFIRGGAISRDCFGKYRIADYLMGTETLEFEEKLNNYLRKVPMSLKDKFIFHRKDIVNYANLTSQVHQTPYVMIENILSSSFNREILLENGLLKTMEEVTKMSPKEQILYLKNIAKLCCIPKNSTLVLKDNSVFLHEIGHINHYANLTEKEHLQLQQMAMFWRMPIAKARTMASRVSSYSMVSPMEFVAETYSGLVNGQTFLPDVMEWYMKLKGPAI